MGKAVHGSAFLAVCGLAAGCLVVWPAHSVAQQVDPAALTECLIANTTEDHINAMKRLMIAALEDNIGTLKSEAANYGNIIVQLATANCHIAAAQLTDPAVNDAVSKYGERIGEEIMTDAFAKLQ
jgi:hypothetical protein